MSNDSAVATRSLARRSALGTEPGRPGREVFSGTALRIVEEPFLRVASLRRSRLSRDDGWLGSRAQSSGIAVPARPRQMTGDTRRALAHVEPHAWIATGPVDLGAAGAGWMVTDVGDRLAAFHLGGEHATDVVSSGGNAHGIAAGMCCRVAFAETAAVILQRFGENEWRLLVDASLGSFLAQWLADAGATASPP